MKKILTLRPVTGPPGSRLARLLGRGLEPVAPLRGPTGCFERVVAAVDVDGSSPTAAESSLPQGAAVPEAVAVRLRAGTSGYAWGEPIVVPGVRALLDLCRARGRSSIEIARVDSTLVSGLQLGAWFDAPWRMRLLRRLALRLPRAWVAWAAFLSPRWLAAAADIAFWECVRERATELEWNRLTANSYVALCYHRFAGELKPGQERIDISPRRFARHLRMLRLAGFCPLPVEELIAFHEDRTTSLPPRRIAITVDDGMADAVPHLVGHATWRPLVFVPTAELGGTAHWLDGEPLATWEELRTLEDRGVTVGSHLRHHRRATQLDAASRRDELAGSLADLRQRLRNAQALVAYPYGDHDDAVCEQAREAGFRVGFTTIKGRNGGGTGGWCLKRVSVHGADGALAVLWKAVTGEALPASWLRFRSYLRKPQAATRGGA